jgi:hypothetical protein
LNQTVKKRIGSGARSVCLGASALWGIVAVTRQLDEATT